DSVLQAPGRLDFGLVERARRTDFDTSLAEHTLPERGIESGKTPGVAHEHMLGTRRDAVSATRACVQKIGLAERPGRPHRRPRLQTSSQQCASRVRKRRHCSQTPGGPMTSCHIQTRKPYVTTVATASSGMKTTVR